MLILFWQQTAAASGSFISDGDSDFTFDGGSIAASVLTCDGDSDCTFDSDTVSSAPFVPTGGSGGQHWAPPPPPEPKRARRKRKARTFFGIEGESRARIASAARAGSSFEAGGSADAVAIAGARSASSFFVIDGEPSTAIDASVRSAAAFVIDGDSVAALGGGVIACAAFIAGGDAAGSLSAGACGAVAFIGCGEGAAAFGVSAAPQSCFNADGGSAFLPLSSGSSVARWTGVGAADFVLAAAIRQAAAFTSNGESDVIITGLEHGTFEAALRRVTEAFGRKVGEIIPIDTRADEAPPQMPAPIAKPHPGITSTVSYIQMTGRWRSSAPRGRVPRGKPPTLHEAEYARRLISWLDEIRGELAGLPRLLPVRVDESRHGGRVREMTEPVRRKVARDLVRLEPEIQRTGRSVAAASKQMLDRQTKAALGVEIPTRDERIPHQIDQFISKNMTRIRSLGDRLVGEVETIMIDAWDRGLSQAEVQAEIEARIGVAESYARFLARDQMNALYAQVTRARHQEIGVRLFRWWTEDDGNVRPSHFVKHRKIFPYEGSRKPSFLPGEDYGCRCWEEPVFDEIKARAFADKGRRRSA